MDPFQHQGRPAVFAREISKRDIWEKAKQVDQQELPGFKNLVTLVGQNFGVAKIDIKTPTEHVFWEER